MKLLYKIVVPVFAMASLQASAQIKNAKTETVTVHGNCGMCKETIEKAATEKKISEASWDKDTHQLTLTYDASKTTTDALLKKVAHAGYDNDKYLAPQDAYNKLPGCCQYERPKEAMAAQVKGAHTGHDTDKAAEKPEQATVLKEVYASYFSLKDALIKSDGAGAATAASSLAKALKDVPMDKMEHNVHMVWMQNLPTLQEDAEHIADTKDLTHQRDHFVTLSASLYQVARAFEPGETMYYQHCPMYNDGKGANWLSKDKEVKNPYYGSKMLSCGKTVETLK